MPQILRHRDPVRDSCVIAAAPPPPGGNAKLPRSMPDAPYDGHVRVTGEALPFLGGSMRCPDRVTAALPGVSPRHPRWDGAIGGGIPESGGGR